MSTLLKGVNHDNYFLSVKFGVPPSPEGGIYGLDVKPHNVKGHLTYSLRRLGLDYIDLYQPARQDTPFLWKIWLVLDFSFIFTVRIAPSSIIIVREGCACSWYIPLSIFTKGDYGHEQRNQRTDQEKKRAIRALVLNRCANYDCKLGCIAMDSECYMLQKEYCSYSLCRYFRTAVLPKDPVLEATLTGVPAKRCPICGQRFPRESRRKYCSDSCAR